MAVVLARMRLTEVQGGTEASNEYTKLFTVPAHEDCATFGERTYKVLVMTVDRGTSDESGEMKRFTATGVDDG